MDQLRFFSRLPVIYIYSYFFKSQQGLHLFHFIFFSLFHYLIFLNPFHHNQIRFRALYIPNSQQRYRFSYRFIYRYSVIIEYTSKCIQPCLGLLEKELLEKGFFRKMGRSAQRLLAPTPGFCYRSNIFYLISLI